MNFILNGKTSPHASPFNLDVYELPSLPTDTCSKPFSLPFTEAVVRRCSEKKVFFKTSQSSQENTCVGVSFSIKLHVPGLQSPTLFRKKLQHWRFPARFSEFFRTPFLQNTSDGCFCV